MSVFNLAQSVQNAPGWYKAPDIAAVDTNFLVGAYLDSDPLRLNILQALEQQGAVLVITSKAIDELMFRIQDIGERRYMDQAGVVAQRKKPGQFLAGTQMGHARAVLSGYGEDVLDLLQTQPFVTIETTAADVRFGLTLFREYGTINADAQIISTAIRNGVCDIISDDGDYVAVQNINQWTTRTKIVNTVMTDVPITFNPADWTAITPPNFFDLPKS